MLLKAKKCKKRSDVTKLKKKSTKKTVMPQTPVTLSPTQVSAQALPDLHVLRNDANIKAQVEQILKDLVEDNRSGTKIKSLRGGSVEVVVSNRVKWPQEYVVAGTKKKHIQYDQLSMSQWVAGFCHIMKEEKMLKIKNQCLTI